MSNKHKRKGKSKFIMIDGYVKRCAAWKALTPVERNAYLEVKWRYDGTNNGRIGLGCRELAEELRMSRNTADRALHVLASRGFIAVAKPSAFHVKNRSATEWRLTEYQCDVTGALPSKEFMRWEPTSSPPVPHKGRTGGEPVPKEGFGREPKKQQSHPRDTQSHPRDCDPKSEPEKHPHSPTHGTVGTVFEFSQSHPRDTYISTIPSSELEEGVTRLGELVQPQIKGEASKLTGRRSPAQREQSKKYLSSLEERRASAREREAKAKADHDVMVAAIMRGAR